MWTAIIGGLTSLFSSGADAYTANQQGKTERVKAIQEQQIQKIKGKTEIEKAKIGAEVARYNAQAEAAAQTESNTQEYDLVVLKNRSKTYADEFIIVIWFAVFLCHFVPSLQPYMAGGWKAMGYTAGTSAWWFEFGMVGILVSTLGLMRVLKMFVEVFRAKFGGSSKSKD